MDEAEDLSVSGFGRWLASRRTDHRQDGLVCLPGAARAAGLEKHVTPHTLRQASAYCTTFQSSFILKTIGLGRAGSAAVYGRRVVPLSPVPVPS